MNRYEKQEEERKARSTESQSSETKQNTKERKPGIEVGFDLCDGDDENLAKPKNSSQDRIIV